MTEFPSLEEWEASPIGKYARSQQDRILMGWAQTISEMSEPDHKQMLDNISRMYPLIHKRIVAILNKGVANERI